MLQGRSLMLVRNVGHLMTTDAVLDTNGEPIPEGILDAMVTSAIALHDVGRNGRRANSRTGSVYIVKPKMHGPEEVAFASTSFSARVEEALGLPPLHAQNGDHGRGAAHDAEPEGIDPRRARTASSSSTPASSTAPATRSTPRWKPGPMIRKGDMKASTWIQAYEDSNVDIGLACGLPGHAQIGKGMWAMPDLMADMLESRRSRIRRPARTPRGCPPPPRRRCMRCTITRST